MEVRDANSGDMEIDDEQEGVGSDVDDHGESMDDNGRNIDANGRNMVENEVNMNDNGEEVSGLDLYIFSLTL